MKKIIILNKFKVFKYVRKKFIMLRGILERNKIFFDIFIGGGGISYGYIYIFES